MRRLRVPAIIATIASCPFFANACFSGGDDEAPFPELTPFSSDLQSKVHEIRDRASQIRGLPVNDEIKEGTLSPEALKAYAAASVAKLTPEEEADLDAAGVVLKLLGVIGDDVDLKKVLSEEFSGVIAGLYSHEKDSLMLIGAADGDLSLEDQITLAHEYTHSFQDRTFDLGAYIDKYQHNQLEDDGYAQYSDTISCVYEGDAVLAQEKYGEQFIGPDYRDKIDAQTPADVAESIQNIPIFLLRAFAFDYNECPEFIRALQADGGWDAVNRAYQDPPATTEQVMHPEKYRGRELASTGPPVDLGEQLDGWRQLDSSQFGEFDVYNWAATLTGDAEAAHIAGAGWGSGWARSYRDEKDPARAIIQVSLGWDTQQDLLEFLAVYDAMLTGLGAQGTPVSEGNIRWTAPGQFGALTLDKVHNRVEMRVATDTEGLKAATKDLPQFK